MHDAKRLADIAEIETDPVLVEGRPEPAQIAEQLRLRRFSLVRLCLFGLDRGSGIGRLSRAGRGGLRFGREPGRGTDAQRQRDQQTAPGSPRTASTDRRKHCSVAAFFSGASEAEFPFDIERRPPFSDAGLLVGVAIEALINRRLDMVKELVLAGA